MSELPKNVIEPIVSRALEEDLGSGDITSAACIDANAACKANAVARQKLIVCGSDVASCVFAKIDPHLRFEVLACDGMLAMPGDILWSVEGNTRSILMGERVALNFIQRMSGIATMTHAYVKAVPAGYATRLLPIREKPPGIARVGTLCRSRGRRL